MGDMADFTLEHVMDDVEHYEKFRDASLSVQYEEGLIDEYGVIIGKPSGFHTKIKKQKYIKKCPKCNNNMHLINGPYGKFYGCNAYPKCNGNRNIE